MLVNNRRSGRTTQIKENCFKFASEGETVFFVFPTREMASCFFDNLAESSLFEKIKSELSFYHKKSGSVRFIGANQLTNVLVGRGECRIFFDHTVSEHCGVKIDR